MRPGNEQMKQQPTRGDGILEPLLARLRAQRANQLIPVQLRSGRVLDIGSGSFPYFLAHTSFREKFAIDRLPARQVTADVVYHSLDLNSNPHLPFEDRYFRVVTMLALIEHLDPRSLVDLFKESRRVLEIGGMVVLTTPAAWSDRLLRLMARIGLVSPEEISEHVYPYSLPLVGWYFGVAGFDMLKLDFGYFEFGLNMWATARR